MQLATSKLKPIQLLRKFTCRYLRVSLLNTVSLKEIEQVVFMHSINLKLKKYNINNTKS